MKMFLSIIMFTSVVFAQSYSGQSSASLQLQINVVLAQQKQQTDQIAFQAAQQALQANRLATQLSNLQTQLTAAQAAGQ